MYTIKQSERNEWIAETVIALENNRELYIRTKRGFWGGLNTTALVSTATVVNIDPNEPAMQSHAIGYNGKGDFSKQLEATAVRCTQSAVKAQHERHIADTDPLLASIAAHYAAQQAAKVAA